MCIGTIFVYNKTMLQALALTTAALLPLLVLSQPFEQNLYFGLRNNCEGVRLQEFLRSQGYFSEPVSTGNYFQRTLEAVRGFQKAQGLPAVGGYFGPQTRAVSNRILSQFRSSSPPPASATPPAPASQSSPYQGKIFLRSVSGTSRDPLRESVILENRTKDERIIITGFSLENSSGESFTIPKGQELAGFSTAARDPIILKPGDRATITVGIQERRMDFRENLCTGYFDQYSSFRPSLRHSCPEPDTKELLRFSDRCLRAIDSITACREPQALLFLEDACVEFIHQHFNYAGCVRDYRNAANFYSNRWFIWMQRSGEFFRNVREKVTLKDQNGLVAEEYSY